MNTTAQTSTGHTLVVDLAARRLRCTAGDLATVDLIPREELKALCRGCACRVAAWERVSADSWRIETHDDLSYRRPPRG